MFAQFEHNKIFRNHALLVVMAVLLAASCTKGDFRQQEDALTGTPMLFSTAVSDLSTKATVLTSGSIGLVVTTEGEATTADSRYCAINRKMAYTSGSWVQVDAALPVLLWKNSTATVTYIAYCPYSAAASVSGALSTNYPLSVASDQSADEDFEASDFLYTTGTTTGALSGAEGIELTLDHKLSKVKISLTLGNELTSAGTTVSAVSLYSCCALFGAINLQDGNIIDRISSQNQTVIMHPNATPTEFEAILIPQTFAAGRFVVEVALSNSTKLYYTSAAAISLESGKTTDISL